MALQVASSSLALQSSHVAESRREVMERLRIWRGERPDFEARESRNAGAGVNLSGQAREAVRATAAPSQAAAPSGTPAAGEAADAIDAADNDPRLVLLRLIIEAMTGKPVRLMGREDLPDAASAGEAPAAPPPQSAPNGPANGRANFGMEYDRTETVSESESTTFAATGVAKTADGKEIAFSVDFQMSREFSMTTSESLRAGNAVRKDPLVINFGGAAAQLESGRMAFDIEGDGTREQVATLAAGSGYLVLDLNGNGRADDGRELFGTATGNGFAELAAYDDDGNGWIDEGDSVWSKLGVWSPATEAMLKTLGSAGVGAISTTSLSTPFSIRDGANYRLGEVVASSAWIGEPGRAGSVQQVDLYA